MYTINRTNGINKAFKRAVKRGLNVEVFEEVIEILRTKGTLPSKYRPHKLSSKFDYVWECHIQSDWLLLWQQDDNSMTLLLINTGSHSNIFG